MKKKDLKFFEELLHTRLKELLSQAGDTVSGMTEQKENFPDPTDRATLESDRNFMLRIRDRSARPVTTQCIDCKTKEEAFEKALGI